MGSEPRVVVGYHGCDRSLVERVVLHGAHLSPSENQYDWLGAGIYFWENGFHRAREFAEWKKRRGDIEHPAAIGAYIHLDRCFDLGDIEATACLPEYHASLIEHLNTTGAELPRNQRGSPSDFDLVLRNLDCAVLNHAMAVFDRSSGSLCFQTVRGVFVEGGPAFEGAGIHRKSHVQIAVRDPSVIRAYFVPRAPL